jgi:hypothetical protein
VPTMTCPRTQSMPQPCRRDLVPFGLKDEEESPFSLALRPCHNPRVLTFALLRGDILKAGPFGLTQLELCGGQL